jgi:hypothetical protein
MRLAAGSAGEAAGGVEAHGGRGAPSAGFPRGSTDVNIFLSEEADNEVETTTLCLGAPQP